MTTLTNYEAPELVRIGTVADSTASAGHVNSDNQQANNNAFSNPF